MRKRLLMLIFVLLLTFCWSAEYIFMWGNSPSVSNNRVTGMTTTADFYNGFTYSSNSITASTGTSGAYYIKASISFSSDTAGNYTAEIKQNSTTVAKCIRRIGDTSDIGNVSLGALVNVSANDNFYLDLTGTGTESIKFVQFVITEVGEEENPSYAEMYISSTQETAINDNNFTTITGFTSGDLSNWSFASNTLTPTSNALGKYLAIFSCSYELTTGTETTFDMGLGLGASDPTLTNIISERTLSSNSDIGNATMCGILNIDSTSDLVTALAKEINTTTDLQVNRAAIVLIKITDDFPSKMADMATNSTTTVTSNANQVTSMIDASTLESGWDFSSLENNLTCKSSEDVGKYIISYHLNSYMESQNSSADLTASLRKSNTEIIGSAFTRALSRGDVTTLDYGVGSGVCIAEVSSTDYIELFGLSSNSNKNIVIENANVSLWRIDYTNGTLPVELSSFNAMATSTSSVALNWTVQSESNGSGYRVYRNNSNDLNTATMLETFIPAHNLPYTHTYTFNDEEIINATGQLFYWIKFIELDNSYTHYGPVLVQFETPSNDLPPIIISEGIKSTYPNPFNPTVTISYYVKSPKSVTFEIYNVKGQLIKTIVEYPYNEGVHQVNWNGKDDFNKNVASGVYFVKSLDLNDNTPVKVLLSK